MYSMRAQAATHNPSTSPAGSAVGAPIGTRARWYVPRPLGESGKKAPYQRLRGAKARIATAIALAAMGVGPAACGGGQRQDVTESAGNFPTQVTKANFPNHQLLAETSDLVLAIKNVGRETIPNLAVTIYTGNTKAGVTATGSGQGSFNIRLDDPSLSEPNRPVWILENRYPKLLTPGVTVKNVSRAPTAGAVAARTDTFQFGAIPPGETKNIDWRVTAVRVGTYTLHYEVAAGLEGKAKAVTPDGRRVKGELVVTISSKPPQTCVNGGGQVVSNCGP
jgi:hypothetical protein